jgi:ABC-2 type transport system permease protein
MKQALHAELTKIRTLASTWWLLLATATMTVALSATVAASVHHRIGADQDPAKISLAGIQVGQAMVALLAVLAMSSEYASGTILTTLTATPRRLTVLTAKATIVTVLVLMAGVIGTLGSVLAGRLLLHANGFTAAHGYPPLSLTDGSVLRAAAGSVLYLALIALLSLGLATALRDAAIAVGVVLGVLYLTPLLAHVLANPDWERQLQRYAPTNAGLAIQATTSLRSLPISPWAGLGVLAAWATATLIIGGFVLCVRDA